MLECTTRWRGAGNDDGGTPGIPIEPEEKTMATTEHHAVTTTGDAAAIAELSDIVERQRTAFLADRSRRWRRDRDCSALWPPC